MSLTKATYSMVTGAPYNVLDYGADPTGNTDSTSAIQTAINAAGVTRGMVYFPTGTYQCSSTITMSPYVTLKGSNSAASVVKWSSTGDGMRMTSTLNSPTQVYNVIEDLLFWCTNAANTGGGYVDIAGVEINFKRFRVQGFKYGIILDQSELVDIEVCNFALQTTAGVWLVNGGDHTAGALGNYTNRIAINNSQFNQGASSYCILDDGGYAHTFDGNNYNGGLHHIRNAGQIGINISNGEFEGAQNTNLIWTTTTLNTATSVGQSLNICVQNNFFIPRAGQHIIAMDGGTPLNLINNYFGNNGGGVALLLGLSSIDTLVDIGNIYAGAFIKSGSPTYEFDAINQGTFTPTITFANDGNLAVTYAKRTGKYTRVQNRVHISILIETSAFTHTTASGNFRITGLPFVSDSTTDLFQPLAMTFQGITKASYTQFTPVTDYGQSWLLVTASGSGQNWDFLDEADVPTGGTVVLFINGSYEV